MWRACGFFWVNANRARAHPKYRKEKWWRKTRQRRRNEEIVCKEEVAARGTQRDDGSLSLVFFFVPWERANKTAPIHSPSSRQKKEGRINFYSTKVSSSYRKKKKKRKMIQLENTPRKAIGIWTPSGILQPGGSARRGTISNSPRVSSRHLRAFNRRIFFFFLRGKTTTLGHVYSCLRENIYIYSRRHGSFSSRSSQCRS